MTSHYHPLLYCQGGLEFYESEEQFLEGTDMKNDYRIELKQYNIETNIR